jgi:hypothetical protein
MQHNKHTVLVHSVVFVCASLFCARALREDHLDKVQWALFERCLSNADAHTCICMHTGGGHSTRCVCLQPPPEALLGGSSAADRRPCCKRPSQTSEAWVRSELTLLRRNNLPPTLFGPFPSASSVFCLERRACLHRRMRGSKQIFKFRFQRSKRRRRELQGMRGGRREEMGRLKFRHTYTLNLHHPSI